MKSHPFSIGGPVAQMVTGDHPVVTSTQYDKLCRQYARRKHSTKDLKEEETSLQVSGEFCVHLVGEYDGPASGLSLDDVEVLFKDVVLTHPFVMGEPMPVTPSKMSIGFPGEPGTALLGAYVKDVYQVTVLKLAREDYLQRTEARRLQQERDASQDALKNVKRVRHVSRNGREALHQIYLRLKEAETATGCSREDLRELMRTFFEKEAVFSDGFEEAINAQNHPQFKQPSMRNEYGHDLRRDPYSNTNLY